MNYIKKKVIKKQWFQPQKHEKYVKFKNELKTSLGAFNPPSIFFIFKCDNKYLELILSTYSKDTYYF